MWKCPVCDQENTAATVCPTCGYDRTCDYEQYPTAFAVTTATPTAPLRRQWQAKQGPALMELIEAWYDAPQDTAAAERCFRRLADGGDPAAQYWLGIAYAQGRGAKKDAAQALGWLRKAAQQGHVRAQQKLDAPETQMPDQLFARYQREPDQAKRMEYLKKSAQMGYTPAQAELGDCYAQGRGVEKDYVKASEWYRRAAEQPPQQPEAPQQTETPQQLFELYQQESDQAKRMDYLKKSAETGYAQAQAWMALTYSQGYGVEKNAAEAARWLQRLAQQNSPEAWYWLGRCYSGGWGVEKDPIQAAQWYQKAAEQGDKNAQSKLADCYKSGLGVPRDRTQARYWREKANNT